MSGDEPGAQSPLADSFADAVVLAAARAAVLAVDAPVRLGRIRILRAVGSGAMGTVWLARDETLERDVAVKLLRRDRAVAVDGAAAVMREARTLARLSHPNVVAIHEVGDSERGMFVAMEFVDGVDLGTWLRAEARRPEAIVEVFVQAARGLAAAHAVGVVHRDFKPDNVLVDRQGRVRVADFGLAQAAALEPEPTAGSTGRAWVGTPRYLAPESFAGAAATAAADQYALCVALFEAVGGAPPFDATTVQGLRDAAVAGRVAVPPRPIPRRLRAVIERGLAADPTARWPSMDALIDALASAIRRSPWPRRAVVLSTLSGIAAAIALSWPSSPSCAEDPALRWDDGARARVVEALDGAALPFVATMGPALLSELDGHADALVAAGVAVCWRGRDAVEPDFRAQGANCLADDRRALDEASAAIATGAAPELAVSLARVLALPDPAACVDPRHVALAHAVAPDDDDRVAIREELRELRSIQANLVYGPATPGYGAALDDSIARAEAVALRAEAAADPTQAAAAWLMHARLLLRRSDTAKADASVRRSLERANGLADPTLRVHATIQHVYVIGLDRDRADEAYALGEQARALIDAHGGERLLYAQLDNNLGLVAARDRRDRHASAERFGRAAVEGFTAALGEAHPDTLAARVNLAAGLNQASRPAEALAELAAAQPLAEATWGTDHPSTARLLTVVGNAHLRLGDLDASEQAQRDSLEIQRRCFGPDDGEVANAQYNLALVLRRRGRHDEAATLLLRAIAIREALVGADAPELILWLLPTGESLVESGRAADAVAPLRRALALCEADGAPAKDFARVRFALARALEESAPIEALALADAARAWFAAQDDREAVGRVDVLRARLGAPVDG